ncbi:hypothetical protein AVEN_205344-1 [Araneus ventricosus]|uniref:Uncharacterized protein n=1 Tax=Araneus ventricosus TaxID=182803 RepID=A0A4Y2QY30_ARAVE|nr:hypothetical protein AVEN_205344-1 [Araneus ventricosus]
MASTPSYSIYAVKWHLRRWPTHMASTPHRSPNIFKDTMSFSDYSSSNGGSCRQVHVRIYWNFAHNGLQGTREKNQDEINQIIWGGHVTGSLCSIHQRPNNWYPASVLCKIHVHTSSGVPEKTFGTGHVGNIS